MTDGGTAFPYWPHFENETVADFLQMTVISASTSGSSGIAEKKHIDDPQTVLWQYGERFQLDPWKQGVAGALIQADIMRPLHKVIVTTGTVPGLQWQKAWEVETPQSYDLGIIRGVGLVRASNFATLTPPPSPAYGDDPHDLTSGAMEVVSNIQNSEIAAVAAGLLMQIQGYLNRTNIHGLLPLWAIILDDGSLLIEWVSPHWRMGFRIELNQEDSSWNLVSDKVFGEVNAFGDLIGVNLNWLLTFATNTGSGLLDV